MCAKSKNTKVEEVEEIEEKVKEKIETKSKNTDKYVRIALDAPMEERKTFSEKEQRGELKLSHYTIDNDKGYHYYLVLRK